MNPILIVPAERDDGPPGHERPRRPVRRLRREVLAAARARCEERPAAGADDPLLESWRKLLAKYRQR